MTIEERMHYLEQVVEAQSRVITELRERVASLEEKRSPLTLLQEVGRLSLLPDYQGWGGAGRMARKIGLTPQALNPYLVVARDAAAYADCLKGKSIRAAYLTCKTGRAC
jgi:hypothetical protein